MRALPLVLAIMPTAIWAGDIPLSSDVTAVTLYPHGATVVREAPFEASQGRHDLILTDLPQGTPLQSVRVAVSGATLGSVTARNDFVPPRDEDTNAAIQAAEAEVERLEDALREAEAGVEAIRLEEEAAAARVAFLEQLGEGEGVAALDAAALRDLVGLVGEETLSALREAHDAQLRAGAAERGLKDLREELEKARQALRALVPEDKRRAMLAISIDAPEAAQGMVSVTYNIGNASWLPVYDLKLARDSGQLKIERGAFVFQGTGENWEDVALTLSTVRPSEQTAPSVIWPWLRRIFDPEELQQKPVARSQAEMEVFADAAGQVAAEPMALEEESAVASFDGLAVTYSYPEKVSVASGADRVRIALGTLETRADLVAQAVPLSDRTAFLMARITNDMNELILPTGEASFYLDGRFIGRQYLELIPAGAEADLSFGPIDGLQLTRVVQDRNEGDGGIIIRSNEFTEDVRIEVENLTGETWPLRVLDRVPYSEQEDLEVWWEAKPKPTETDVDDKRGVLAWEFDLAPGETKSISTSHQLDWPDGKMLQ